MDYNQYLKVNKRIELEVNRGPYQGSFNSKISDIKNDKIKILTPTVKGELVPLRKNLKLDIFYTGNTAAYKFTSRIVDRELEPVPVLVIKYPEKVERIQRRDYFRLQIQIEVKYRHVDSEGEPLDDKFRETISRDLSGGGIKMVVENELNVDTLLELYLDIPEIKKIPIMGKVVQTHTEEKVKTAGIEFKAINPQLRDQIVGWLFDKQRELRQKGLL
ncbi:MAG: flagellar brake protein [Bacillota bacterium]